VSKDRSERMQRERTEKRLELGWKNSKWKIAR